MGDDGDGSSGSSEPPSPPPRRGLRGGRNEKEPGGAAGPGKQKVRRTQSMNLEYNGQGEGNTKEHSDQLVNALLGNPNDSGGTDKSAHLLASQLSTVSKKAAKTKGETKCCILAPMGTKRMTWDVVLILLLGYIAVTMPYRMCFDQPATGWVLYFEIGIDLLFIVDIFLNFNTGVIDDDGVEHSDRRSIAKNYLAGWFWLDTSSGVPFDLIDLLMQDDSGMSDARTLKVLKTGRVLKTFKLLRLTKLFKAMKNLKTLENILEAFATTAFRSVFRILSLLVLFFIVAHWLSCLYAYFGSDPDNGWTVNAKDNYDVKNLYLSSLYFSIETMTSVGYGDLIPQTDRERAYTIVMIMIGAITYSYIIASMASIVSTMDSNKRVVQERMDAIGAFMATHQFPQPLHRSVMRFFRTFYATKSALDEWEIIGALPNQLQSEVVDYLIGDVSIRCEIFNGLEAPIMGRLLPALTPIEIESGENMINANEACSEMYIVLSGSLAIIDANYPDKVLGSVQVGDTIGELCALGIDHAMKCTVVSLSPCKCYMLSGDDLFQQLAKHPKEIAHMRERAIAKYYHDQPDLKRHLMDHFMAGLDEDPMDTFVPSTNSSINRPAMPSPVPSPRAAGGSTAGSPAGNTAGSTAGAGTGSASSSPTGGSSMQQNLAGFSNSARDRSSMTRPTSDGRDGPRSPLPREAQLGAEQMAALDRRFTRIEEKMESLQTLILERLTGLENGIGAQSAGLNSTNREKAREMITNAKDRERSLSGTRTHSGDGGRGGAVTLDDTASEAGGGPRTPAPARGPASTEYSSRLARNSETDFSSTRPSTEQKRRQLMAEIPSDHTKPSSRLKGRPHRPSGAGKGVAAGVGFGRGVSSAGSARSASAPRGTSTERG